MLVSLVNSGVEGVITLCCRTLTSGDEIHVLFLTLAASDAAVGPVEIFWELLQVLCHVIKR